MPRLLVTGASGFLGRDLCQVAARSWQVFGVVFSHPVQVPGATVVQADLTDPASLEALFQRVRPDAVVHAAAISDPNFCQTHPQESWRLNVEASERIAALCARLQVPCAFTSSDLVFDGARPPYAEEAPVCPINVYGQHKAEAERRMAQAYPEVTICRLPPMFGVPGPAGRSFIQPMVKALREGGELRLFVDEYRTPTSARTAAEGIVLAMGRVRGPLHLGGPQRISRYDFGRLLASVLGFKGARLTPCRQRDVPMPAPRPPDVSLDSSKAVALGFRRRPLEEELQELKSML